LQELILQSGENAWTLPIIDNQWHPLSSIINRSILSDLEDHLNNKKLKLMRFIESIDYKLLNCDERFPWFHPHILDNMNDKLTLKGIEERLK
jgi:molybdopterin-guanine dinucleotide biosynthesis protein A